MHNPDTPYSYDLIIVTHFTIFVTTGIHFHIPKNIYTIFFTKEPKKSPFSQSMTHAIITLQKNIYMILGGLRS